MDTQGRKASLKPALERFLLPRTSHFTQATVFPGAWILHLAAQRVPSPLVLLSEVIIPLHSMV